MAVTNFKWPERGLLGYSGFGDDDTISFNGGRGNFVFIWRLWMDFLKAEEIDMFKEKHCLR